MNIIDLVGLKWWLIVILLGLYTFLYIVLKNIDRNIYLKAPFKKEWMNKEIYEAPNKVKRVMRIEFAVYVAIIIMLGTGSYSPWAFALMSLVFTVTVAVKAYFLFKNEKTSIKL